LWGEDMEIRETYEKEVREKHIDDNLKTTTKLVTFEIDFLCKIERVLIQYNALD